MFANGSVIAGVDAENIDKGKIVDASGDIRGVLLEILPLHNSKEKAVGKHKINKENPKHN